MGQKSSVAAHCAFQIEAPFGKACGWAQTCPSAQVLFLPRLHLVSAFPSLLSPLHLLPQTGAAQATSPAHLYPYLDR